VSTNVTLHEDGGQTPPRNSRPKHGQMKSSKDQAIKPATAPLLQITSTIVMFVITVLPRIMHSKCTKHDRDISSTLRTAPQSAAVTCVTFGLKVLECTNPTCKPSHILPKLVAKKRCYRLRMHAVPIASRTNVSIEKRVSERAGTNGNLTSTTEQNATSGRRKETVLTIPVKHAIRVFVFFPPMSVI
jgi:hypothetical protein